jgi:hypothetical protein
MKRRIICLVDRDEKAQELTRKLIRGRCSRKRNLRSRLSAGPRQSCRSTNQPKDAETHVSAGEEVGLFAGVGQALPGAVGPFLAADPAPGSAV